MPTGSQSTFTPDMSDVIRTLVDQMLLQLFVCLPAKIVSYDSATQYANVEVQLLKAFTDGSTQAHPVIPNVPVKHPRAAGGTAFIHMPLEPGDDVTLVFSQRSLDNWKTQGGMTATGDTRKHHITDAYALIGGSAIPDAFTPAADGSIEIVNGDGKINIYPSGKFKFGNASADLIDQLQQGFQKLSEDTVNTIFGPSPLNNFSTYADIATALGSLKE
jgi:hypothetical protein